MLNSDEVQQFERDRFFVNRRLLDGELLNRMRDAFDQLDGYHNLLDRDMNFLGLAAMLTLLDPITAPASAAVRWC